MQINSFYPPDLPPQKTLATHFKKSTPNISYNDVFLSPKDLPHSLFPAKNDPNSNIAKLWNLLQEPFVQIYVQIQQLYQTWNLTADSSHPLAQLFSSITKQVQKYPKLQTLLFKVASSSPTVASIEAILSEIPQLSSWKVSDTTHATLLDSFKKLDNSWNLSPGDQSAIVKIEAVTYVPVESIRLLLLWITSCIGVPGIPINLTLDFQEKTL